MHNRLRLLMGATALLYLGPLLAGLAGHGWAVLPLFTAIFCLWIFVMRPWVLPRRLAPWARAQTWQVALPQVATMVALVLLCFGIGRGIGGVMGVTLALPTGLPAAISFLSIPLSRLLWNPLSGQKIDRFLDAALLQITDPSASRLGDAQALSQAVLPLLDLPGDADPETTSALLHETLAGTAASERLEDLVYALNWIEPDRSALRRALILWATDPTVALRGAPFGTPERAFQLAGSDPHMLGLFCSRAAPLIDRFPELALAFPEVRDLEFTIDDSLPADLNAALADLARRLDAALPPALRRDAEDPQP